LDTALNSIDAPLNIFLEGESANEDAEFRIVTFNVFGNEHQPVLPIRSIR